MTDFAARTLRRAGIVSVLFLILGVGVASAEIPQARVLLFGEFAGAEERPGLGDGTPAGAEVPAIWREGGGMGSDASRWTPSPFVAGILSAVVPGAGQLAMGQQRGWVYLGLETAGWFSHWALHEAGAQSKRDYGEFADAHWAWARYDTSAGCGEGLGPINFDEERALLREAYERSRDEFYDDIGRLDVYACGWDDQRMRGRFLGMQDDADALFRSARYAFTLVFLNHVISAVDAAKSASNRRKRQEKPVSWNWDVYPGSGGDLTFRAAVNRRF